MKKSVKRISRRMIAIALSVVMTLSGMTAYASEIRTKIYSRRQLKQ